MKYLIALLTCAVFISMGRKGVADKPAADKPELVLVSQIDVSRCPIEYDRVTTLGAHLTGTASGKLQELTVRRGDHVKTGEVIGYLYDEDLQGELRRVKSEVENGISIRVAESKVAVASSRLQHSKSLKQRNFLSNEEMEIHQFELSQSEFALEEAKQIHRLTSLAKERIEVEIRARKLVSPHNGVVVDIFKTPGESLSPNEPIVEIVDVDLLRVTGFADASDSWRVLPGQVVKIIPDLNGLAPEIEKQEFPGKVVFVDSRVDKDTQTFRIMAEVANQGGLLRSGLECHMIVYLGESDTPPDQKPLSKGALLELKPSSKGISKSGQTSRSPAPRELAPQSLIKPRPSR